MSQPPRQFMSVPNPCDCEHPLPTAWTIGHYDVKSCACGKQFWAIQPKRNGKLIARPWPGPNKKAEKTEIVC